MINGDFKKQIKIAEGFQYSVNIAYDINNDSKIKGFIPTTASLEIIEDILLSTFDSSNDRARILIGAYGKGKSHIVLVLLSMLLKKDISLFDGLLTKIKEYSQELYNYALEYIESDKKLLPIVIQGSYANLTQSFLGALQKSLEVEGLEDLMPETHYQAAIDVIKKWKSEYKETYKKLTNILNEPVSDFVSRLSDFDVDAYDKFVELYPSLTSGSIFNPFLESDVVDLYTKVVEKLAIKGYNGIYVVYDEFSKYLETNITKTSLNDMKLLQDFAEKCNRSKEKQMHLLLISHKNISNYIDKLPKQKVDGWKGVSERFKHIEVRNNFSQIYEIIATVIKHDTKFFSSFYKKYDDKFKDIMYYLSETDMFSELEPEQIDTVVYGCYPLHPVSTFVLPRLSEKVAQNERTLFTFLSSKNRNTLSAFIEKVNSDFPMLTPDYIYDYFEPLFKKEVYTSDVHKIYTLTSNILNKLEPDSLGSKVVKTIAVIYIVNQFEKLPPIPDIIINTFRETVHDISEITNTLCELQDKQYVIYMKKSNNYLKLKNSIGIDIRARIADAVEKNKSSYRVKDILNNASFDNYMYPTSYNDDFEITRYFDFTFIESREFFEVENWNKKIDCISADGVIYGIIPKDEEEIKVIKEILESGKASHQRIVFVLPQNYYDIENIAFEYQAIKSLREQSLDDEVLLEEYNIYIEDLEEVIDKYISAYTKPETRQAEYYYMGERKQIFRKAQISQLLSKICKNVYPLTPVINNESINKDFLPTVAINSRGKVINGLLSNKLEPNLGLTGTGQDISIMRSTLIMTGILNEESGKPVLAISGNKNANIQNVLDEIIAFFKGSTNNNLTSFKLLYDKLTKPEYHIGMKKGVIPIYLAVVLHFFKQYAVITRGRKEVEINAELLNSINENPNEYYFYLEDWSEAKDSYIKGLEELFADNIVEKEKEYNTFAYIVRAMQRWFLALPKFTKEMSQIYAGNGNFEKIEPKKIKFISGLKQIDINAREFLFEKVFKTFNLTSIDSTVIENIKAVKDMLDNAKDNLLKILVNDVRRIFQDKQSDMASLSSVIKDWYDGLQETTRNHLFNNNEEKILELMRTITNDDKLFIERMAKAITGLRIDDWNDKTIINFINGVKVFKNTVEEQDKSFKSLDSARGSNVYKITFIDSSGIKRTKTFKKIEYSAKAKLLYNEITTALDDFGQAISESEKRQVLIEIIEKLC
ncbi:MAG: hypothetical protein JG777_2147 [Clostridia bacterium]|jgi:hypothetical protein|nr:hypothetical protein [Clostridia bacterium]